MKRTIEIDDTLADRVESAIDELRDALLRHCAENSCDEAPNIDVFGYQLHEIAYGAVPASYSELRGIWYLYEWELLAAYKNAGIGDNPRENDGMAAIYCYILRQCEEWYEDNAEEVVEEFLAGKENKVTTITIRELRRRYELCMLVHRSSRGSTDDRNAAHSQATAIGQVLLAAGYGHASPGHSDIDMPERTEATLVAAEEAGVVAVEVARPERLTRDYHRGH